MKQRILNLLVALDSFLYVLLTLGVGHPSETFSSAAWRSENNRGYWGMMRPFIDWLMSPIEDDHCRLAWEYALKKRNLPEDMR